MSDREAFEKWAKEEAKKTSRGFNELTLERDYSSPDYYAKLWVNAAWRGWQASRQALEGEPTAIVNDSGVLEWYPPYNRPPAGTKLYTHPASAEVERLQARVAELESDEQEMAGDNNV